MTAEKRDSLLGHLPRGWGCTGPLAGLCSVPGLDRFGQVQGPHSALHAGSSSFTSPAVHPSSPFCAVEMGASPSLVLQIACSAASGQWKVLSHECRPLSDPLRLPHRSHFPAQVSCVFALLGCLFRDWVCSRACGLSEWGAGPCPQGCPAPGPCV